MHDVMQLLLSLSLGGSHTVSARLADSVAVSKSGCAGAQYHLHNPFCCLRKLQASMSHATPKEMTLAQNPDPDLEVSLIQQLERFKRSLARVEFLDRSELSWLGAVARLQAKTQHGDDQTSSSRRKHWQNA